MKWMSRLELTSLDLIVACEIESNASSVHQQLDLVPIIVWLEQVLRYEDEPIDLLLVRQLGVGCVLNLN